MVLTVLGSVYPAAIIVRLTKDLVGCFASSNTDHVALALSR